MSKVVSVKTYKLRLGAEIAQGALEANGIKSVIFADDAGEMQPYPTSYVAGVDLMVNEKDIDTAKQVLDGTNL